MDLLMERGPNRSTAVDQKGVVGPIRCSGRGAIFSFGFTVGLVPMSEMFCSPGIQNHLVSGSDLVVISLTLVQTNSW